MLQLFLGYIYFTPSCVHSQTLCQGLAAVARLQFYVQEWMGHRKVVNANMQALLIGLGEHKDERSLISLTARISQSAAGQGCL